MYIKRIFPLPADKKRRAFLLPVRNFHDESLRLKMTRAHHQKFKIIKGNFFNKKAESYLQIKK